MSGSGLPNIPAEWGEVGIIEEAIEFIIDLVGRSYRRPEGFYLDDSERSMHEEISAILLRNNIAHEWEYPLVGGKGKVDLFVPAFGLAIELKARNQSINPVAKQLARYMASDRCAGLLLISVSLDHRVITDYVRSERGLSYSHAGKPIAFCWIPPHKWTPEELREPGERKIEAMKASGAPAGHVKQVEAIFTLNQFRLCPDYILEREYENPHVRITAHCTLIHRATGKGCAFGIGESSTMEEEFAWGQGRRICPSCGLETIKRSSYPPRDNPNGEHGWYCNRSIASHLLMPGDFSNYSPEEFAAGIKRIEEFECDAEFDAHDERITSQVAGRVPDEGPSNPHKQLAYRAQERALHAACCNFHQVRENQEQAK